MTLPQLRQLLADAIRQGKKFVQTEPGGIGQYETPYDPTHELEINGYTIRTYDDWCGNRIDGYCYRRFVSASNGEETDSWRVRRLDAVTRMLLEKIPIASNQDIAKEFADVLGDAVVPPDA
jgi:hypothetical protein